MTVKEAYEITVHIMTDIDKEIATLRGKRDAYDEMRACLYSMMEQIDCRKAKCENCINHNYCDYEPQVESEDEE